MGLTDTQLYIKQITNKDLLYSTRHYTQHFGTAGKGKESEYIYIYFRVGHCFQEEDERRGRATPANPENTQREKKCLVLHATEIQGLFVTHHYCNS